MYCCSKGEKVAQVKATLEAKTKKVPLWNSIFPASLRYQVALDDPAFVCCKPLFDNTLVAILGIILNMAPHSGHHLQIINTVPKGTGAFPQFTKLPLELRSMIWEQSLCYERLIRVDLWPGSSLEHLNEDQKWAVGDRLRLRSSSRKAFSSS
ncbi:hypothetical protein QBC33DRAFT_592465 [Phialemonium atrogriseum]|uniref:2EXR domain-containing protein n=1 Tax=Phialemonium atrogriseum TaxID=1093897 RepID=A0AAJ0FT61_9PEZI|nr:uncharacterized protein QBC33DRAFT_592465 [Phialemonium atrogriseum]KAK1771825.1 hypothetical protein QBC33DRAFT_592465 [Phialemonium atrogriseum]